MEERYLNGNLQLYVKDTQYCKEVFIEDEEYIGSVYYQIIQGEPQTIMVRGDFNLRLEKKAKVFEYCAHLLNKYINEENLELPYQVWIRTEEAIHHCSDYYETLKIYGLEGDIKCPPQR